MLLYNLSRIEQFFLNTGIMFVWNCLFLNFGLLQVVSDSKMEYSVIFQTVQGHMQVKSIDIGKPDADSFMAFWKS